MPPVHDAIDFATVKRVLIVKLRHHGDVLLTSPVFSVLKNRYPHLELDALIYEDTQEMLALHPAINTLYKINRTWKERGRKYHWSQEWALFQTLKERRYDLLIHLTEHPRGLWLARLLKCRYRVANEFSGKRGAWWRSSFTHLYRTPATPRHTVETHLDALRRIGVYPDKMERSVTLQPGAAAESKIQSLLFQHDLDTKPFIHLHPTSRWLFKCWEPRKVAELILALQNQGERIVVTAAPTEKEQTVINEIFHHVQTARQANDVNATNPKGLVNFSGRFSLKELAALTAHAKLFIGVDSAPMHIAAAMRTPVIALFGPSGDLEWGPWNVPHRIVSANHSCRPCGLDGCGGGKVSECMMDISVQQVLQAARDLAKL